MRKPIMITVLLTLVMASLLLRVTPVASQVGQAALKACAEFAFSTEEDFVTQGPEPPDGNPIISDGDLLGTGCVVCARNLDLVGGFDVKVDLGLDAADVIDVDDYLVAFSTELDSPNVGQFTAGDLLVTNGVIIANVALTHRFDIGYDIGLDAVHFVGSKDSVVAFLDEVLQYSRDYWVENPGALYGILAKRSIDIWFSTEGTAPTVESPAFLDGDLLSARDGAIVARNSDLLPPSVPAGIPSRGVDFGLDAVTSDRTGSKRRMQFSTEILYRDEIAFTDGDVLEYGTGVVLAKNWDLIKCFEPRAKELGLDALSVNTPDQPPQCISRIEEIAGVSVSDISLVDGMAFSNTVGSPAIPAPVPFGGNIDIFGSLCSDVQEFRVIYRLHGSAGSWTPMPVLMAKNWQIDADAAWNPGADCLGTASWYSDGDGWYNGNDYRHFTVPALGGCNSDLSLTVWESANSVGGKDELYDVMLETRTPSGYISSTVHLVQLDNTPPKAELQKTPGYCETYTSGDMPLSVAGRITDTHFYRARLRISGDGYTPYWYPYVAYYDSPTDNLIDTGTTSWDAFVGLPPDVSVFDLATSPVDGGYCVQIIAWERTLWSAFSFPNDQAYHYPGYRHDTDAKGFIYDAP